MKLLKDLAAFAVNDVGVLFVACSIAFTAGVTFELAKCCDTPLGELLFVVTTVLMVGMDALAVKLAWEDFQDFCADKEN